MAESEKWYKNNDNKYVTIKLESPQMRSHSPLLHKELDKQPKVRHNVHPQR